MLLTGGGKKLALQFFVVDKGGRRSGLELFVPTGVGAGPLRVLGFPSLVFILKVGRYMFASGYEWQEGEFGGCVSHTVPQVLLFSAGGVNDLVGKSPIWNCLFQKDFSNPFFK